MGQEEKEKLPHLNGRLHGEGGREGRGPRGLAFQGILAFQHRQASLRCCRMVRALFCLIPSGIMSRISCITAARSSRSKWDSTRCLVTVLATPFEWRPGRKDGKTDPLRGCSLDLPGGRRGTEKLPAFLGFKVDLEGLLGFLEKKGINYSTEAAGEMGENGTNVSI